MGAALLYYLFIKPLSLLPMWILHVKSYTLYLIVYKLIGYRKKVVYDNLNRSFPEKSNKEIKKIMDAFFLHLCDLIMEAIKGFSMSEAEVNKRMKFTNIELINSHCKEGKHAMAVGGHYGNWEMFALAIGKATDYNPLALYTPMTNEFFNKKFKESRGKYGLEMLSVSDIRNKINSFLKDPYLVIFGADQSPRKNQRAYWTNFLNQETGVQYGAEKFAKEFKAAVFFFNIYKVKRGYYEVDIQMICANAEETEYGYVTEMHTKLLEKVVKEQPEYWLWSHKRWKHSKPEDEQLFDEFSLKDLPKNEA